MDVISVVCANMYATLVMAMKLGCSVAMRFLRKTCGCIIFGENSHHNVYNDLCVKLKSVCDIILFDISGGNHILVLLCILLVGSCIVCCF